MLVRGTRFPARALGELERKARTVPWTDFIAPGSAVAFRVTARKSRLYHTGAIAERLASALTRAVANVDATFGEGAGRTSRESPAPFPKVAASDRPAQLVVVRVAHDEVTVSFDASGEHLHRRGWRLATAKAPLRETLAAAMLAGAAYDGAALVDPLCGSGTIAIEAALSARRIAPGLARAFGAERWPGADPAVWRAVRDAARAQVRPAPAPIVASDRDAGAVAAARANAERAGVAGDITFAEQALSAVAPPVGAGWVVTNPPYGIRVGERAEVRDLYARLGAVLRERFAGWRVAVLSADADPAHPLERQLRLPLTPVWTSNNGGIPVRLLTGVAPR